MTSYKGSTVFFPFKYSSKASLSMANSTHFKHTCHSCDQYNLSFAKLTPFRRVRSEVGSPSERLHNVSVSECPSKRYRIVAEYSRRPGHKKSIEDILEQAQERLKGMKKALEDVCEIINKIKNDAGSMTTIPSVGSQPASSSPDIGTLSPGDHVRGRQNSGASEVLKVGVRTSPESQPKGEEETLHRSKSFNTPPRSSKRSSTQIEPEDKA